MCNTNALMDIQKSINAFAPQHLDLVLHYQMAQAPTPRPCVDTPLMYLIAKNLIPKPDRVSGL